MKLGSGRVLNKTLEAAYSFVKKAFARSISPRDGALPLTARLKTGMPHAILPSGISGGPFRQLCYKPIRPKPI